MEDFAANFTVTESMANEFVNFAVAKGEKRSDRHWPRVKHNIKLAIKAGIARHLWSELGYHYVLNDTDPYLKKAKQVVQQENPLSLK